MLSYYQDVALRKESVDRNFRLVVGSLGMIVALRKESVDRNSRGTNTILFITVALRKESVDRNLRDLAMGSKFDCRSPQGERG